MVSLVESLHDLAAQFIRGRGGPHAATLIKAADTIEAQAAAIELSRKALREACLALETPARRVFADNGDHTIDTSPLDPSIYSACYFASHAVYDALAKIDQALSLHDTGGVGD